MLIARRYGGMSLREIGEAVGGLQYPAVSDAVRRTSARLETDRALEKRFKKALQNLETETLDSTQQPTSGLRFLTIMVKSRFVV
jgi:Arc/MetJ-type ribon-helix-helix transcriptional regulator